MLSAIRPFSTSTVTVWPSATVVDPLCELTGDCPDNCGDGKRQLALVREVDPEATLFVNEVGVAPAHRRRGIGAELTRRLLDRARALGADAAWLATEADNTAARALYNSLRARETPGIVVYDWGAIL